MNKDITLTSAKAVRKNLDDCLSAITEKRTELTGLTNERNDCAAAAAQLTTRLPRILRPELQAIRAGRRHAHRHSQDARAQDRQRIVEGGVVASSTGNPGGLVKRPVLNPVPSFKVGCVSPGAPH